LRPSECLHNFSPNMSKEDIELLKALETSHDIDGEMRYEMYGLFGLQDELVFLSQFVQKTIRRKQNLHYALRTPYR